MLIRFALNLRTKTQLLESGCSGLITDLRQESCLRLAIYIIKFCDWFYKNEFPVGISGCLIGKDDLSHISKWFNFFEVFSCCFDYLPSN